MLQIYTLETIKMVFIEIEPVSPTAVKWEDIFDVIFLITRIIHSSRHRKRARKAFTDQCLTGHARVTIIQDKGCKAEIDT